MPVFSRESQYNRVQSATLFAGFGKGSPLGASRERKWLLLMLIDGEGLVLDSENLGGVS